MYPIRTLLRPSRTAVVAVLLPLLSACAGHSSREAMNHPAPASTRDARGAYRFDMSQNGRRMSADEFDAWMKANGIRVAKGSPGARAKAAAAKPGSTKEVASTSGAKKGAAAKRKRKAAAKASTKPKPQSAAVSDG